MTDDIALNDLLPAPVIPLPETAVPPVEIPLHTNPIDAVRQPDVIATDSYLNDPIEFKTEKRLFQQSIIAEVSGGFVQYQRDESNYLRININQEVQPGQKMPVLMYSPLYKRDMYTKIIPLEFTEL